MKKINIIILLSVLFTLLLGYKNTYANGIGIYFPTISYVGTGTSDDSDVKFSYLGVGIFYDNQISSNRDSNFRIALMYERVTNKTVEHSSSEYRPNYNRYAIDAFSGFRFFKSQRIRLWWGAHIRLSYMSYKSTIAIGTEELYDEWFLGLGGGLIAGCNIHIMNKISLNLEVGGRINYYSGIREQQKDLNMRYTELFLNSGIIFHIGRD